MRKGFELLTTRKLDDSISLSELESKHNIKIPPLYSLFVKTFKGTREDLKIDRLRLTDNDFKNLSFVIYGPDKDLIQFDSFIDIERGLELRKDVYYPDDEVWSKGLIPIASTSSNVVIHVGTRGNEKDQIFMDSEKVIRFTKIHENIFEFVQTLELEIIEERKLRGAQFNSIYKKFGDSSWSVNNG